MRTLPTDPQESVDPGTDERLLRRYQAGDEAAATDIYLRYAPRLRALAHQYCTPNYAGRFDADDVIQSVFRVFFHGARRMVYEVPPEGDIPEMHEAAKVRAVAVAARGQPAPAATEGNREQEVPLFGEGLAFSIDLGEELSDELMRDRVPYSDRSAYVRGGRNQPPVSRPGQPLR